jgi:hypothetical protein
MWTWFCSVNCEHYCEGCCLIKEHVNLIFYLMCVFVCVRVRYLICLFFSTVLYYWYILTCVFVILCMNVGEKGQIYALRINLHKQLWNGLLT